MMKLSLTSIAIIQLGIGFNVVAAKQLGEKSAVREAQVVEKLIAQNIYNVIFTSIVKKFNQEKKNFKTNYPFGDIYNSKEDIFFYFNQMSKVRDSDFKKIKCRAAGSLLSCTHDYSKEPFFSVQGINPLNGTIMANLNGRSFDFKKKRKSLQELWHEIEMVFKIKEVSYRFKLFNSIIREANAIGVTASILFVAVVGYLGKSMIQDATNILADKNLVSNKDLKDVVKKFYDALIKCELDSSQETFSKDLIDFAFNFSTKMMPGASSGQEKKRMYPQTEKLDCEKKEFKLDTDSLGDAEYFGRGCLKRQICSLVNQINKCRSFVRRKVIKGGSRRYKHLFPERFQNIFDAPSSRGQ